MRGCVVLFLRGRFSMELVVSGDKQVQWLRASIAWILHIVKSISGGLSLSPLNCTLSNNGKKDQGLFLCEGDSDSSFWWFRPTVVDAILNAGFSMVQGEYIPGAADAQNYVFVRK